MDNSPHFLFLATFPLPLHFLVLFLFILSSLSYCDSTNPTTIASEIITIMTIDIIMKRTINWRMNDQRRRDEWSRIHMIPSTSMTLVSMIVVIHQEKTTARRRRWRCESDYRSVSLIIIVADNVLVHFIYVFAPNFELCRSFVVVTLVHASSFYLPSTRIHHAFIIECSPVASSIIDSSRVDARHLYWFVSSAWQY